jgi:hypothetical protein
MEQLEGKRLGERRHRLQTRGKTRKSGKSGAEAEVTPIAMYRCMMCRICIGGVVYVSMYDVSYMYRGCRICVDV